MKKAVLDAGIHSEERPAQAGPAAGDNGFEPRAGFLGDMSGRARMNLMASLVMILLFTGFCVTSYFMPENANAWPTKYASCSAASCHGLVDPNGTIATAINGAAGTSVTVAPGGTFEVDWKVNNVTNAAGGQVGVGVEIDLPTGWTLAKGTANSPAITGWNTVWDAADGVTAGWQTANSYSTATEYPSSPVGYTISFDGTAWDTGNRNAAYDNATAGDLDGIADNMGTDAKVTVPAGATPGTYTVVVLGVGHDSAKSHVKQAITVTVSGGSDTTKPVVTAGFAATTPSLSKTIAVSGFAATDDTGVTGYMITASSTAPLSGDAGWLGTAPTSYTVASDGSFTLYPWAKDAAGNVSVVYGSPVTVVVDTVLPTVSSTVPVNGATGTPLDGTVTINFSESVNCATVTTGTVTISPAVTWNQTSCSGTQAVFTPTGQANSTAYTVTIGTGVADSAGNTLAASSPFSYTTSAPAPNNPPAVPSSLTQYKNDGTTVLTKGLYTNLTTLIFKGGVTDPDSDTVLLDIELADVGAAFTGTPTCSSTLVASGSTAAATCSSIANGRFKWQARATDSKGLAGSWTQY